MMQDSDAINFQAGSSAACEHKITPHEAASSPTSETPALAPNPLALL